MKELEVLEDMIDSTYKTKEFNFNLNEFKNQLSEVVKVINSKDKEIELKDKHINELENKCKDLENKCKDLENKCKDLRYSRDMYKSMIQGIFDYIVPCITIKEPIKALFILIN